MILVNHAVEYQIQLRPRDSGHSGHSGHPRDRFAYALADYVLRFHSNAGWSFDSDRIVLADSKATDARLLASRYYEERKTKWFGDLAYPGKRTRLTESDGLDMELNDAERARLEWIVEALGDSVLEHGWYDVVYMV